MPASPTLVTSRANPRVKQLRAAFAGHARLSGGLIAIEGEHLLQEALRSGLPIKTVFLSERIDPPAWLPRGVEQLTLTDQAFSSAVDTQHPQGIAALLIPPTWTIEDALPAKSRANKSPLLLIAAALQDPGNLGTLIRSAEAFGATAVLTTAGTASEWNQKALRASAGSVFRVPVITVTPTEIAALKSRGLCLFAAVADSDHPQGPDAFPIAAADLAQPCALMIGNEGSGLTPELLQISDARITIPTPGRVESLNAAVAGSLLLYEAARQRSIVLN
ncbi:MAG: RNA methyltransferase [Acidobacteriaceae bacterium]|jgi:TrmH family RNA methyltransferase